MDDARILKELETLLGPLSKDASAATFVGAECGARGRTPATLTPFDMVEMARGAEDVAEVLREPCACERARVDAAARANQETFDGEVKERLGRFGDQQSAVAFLSAECFARDRPPLALTPEELGEIADGAAAIAAALRARSRAVLN